MLKRPRSLQGRLLALVIGGVATVWIAVAVLTWRDASHELDELLDGHLAQAAALLVAQQAGEFHDDEVVDAPSLHRYAPRVAFQVFHEGRLVLRSANAPAAPMVDPGPHLRSGYATVGAARDAWRVFATYGAERDVQVIVGERLAARSSILRAVLRACLSGRSSEECVALLTRQQIVVGAVRSYSQVLASADLARSGLVVDAVDHGGRRRYRTLSLPYRFDDAPRPAPPAAPACGADSDALLAEAGYDADEIAALRRSGVVA